MNAKSLKISEESKKNLDALCEYHNINIGEAVETMIAFFHTTHQNPKNYKDLKSELSKLVEKQVSTHQNTIIQAIRSHKAEEIAKKANNLFKKFKEDLEEQRTSVGYVGTVVSDTIKVYLKQFDTLEKENSTFIFPVNK
ncbi:hypothetical protein AD998_21235 [bacterium 336/3]|nr:hypothetical protein AD998_21235 [bacterium 336/3]